MLCLAICAGFVFSANAQNIRVAGKITAANGTGIAGVHIFDSIAKSGTTSDINGVFSLTIPKKVTKLRFSHIAFNTQYILLTKDDIATNTIWLDMVLTQKIMELPLLEISDTKVEIAYKNSKQWILDYEPVGADEFLLLLIEKNKKYLQLVNSNHKIVAVTPVDYKYRRLYKGCFGDIHLLSDNDACQIFLMDDKFYLMHHILADEFANTIEKTMVATDHYLYLKETSPQNHQIAYYKIDTINKSKTLLYTIINQLEIELQKEQLELYKDLINTGEGTDMSSNISASSMRDTPKSENREAQAIRKSFLYNEYLLSQEPYIPLFQINDELCLFNHIDSELVRFSLTGEQTHKTKINYHTDDGWDKEIIVNEEKTHCFAKFTRNGETSLVEINPNTGQMMGRYVLEVHAFPTKIKVRGNEIYYMSKDYFEGEQKYFLWRQKME